MGAMKIDFGATEEEIISELKEESKDIKRRMAIFLSHAQDGHRKMDVIIKKINNAVKDIKSISIGEDRQL